MIARLFGKKSTQPDAGLAYAEGFIRTKRHLERCIDRDGLAAKIGKECIARMEFTQKAGLTFLEAFDIKNDDEGLSLRASLRFPTPRKGHGDCLYVQNTLLKNDRFSKARLAVMLWWMGPEQLCSSICSDMCSNLAASEAHHLHELGHDLPPALAALMERELLSHSAALASPTAPSVHRL